jgi:hypothetical protein
MMIKITKEVKTLKMNGIGRRKSKSMKKMMAILTMMAHKDLMMIKYILDLRMSLSQSRRIG